MNPVAHHLRCVLYAVRTIVRVLPALGSEKDHLNPPPGLSFKHFVVGGVISAVVLVSSLVALVTLVIKLVTVK